MFSPEEIASYRRRGYVVRKGLVDAGRLALVSDWLDGLSGGTAPPADEARYYERSPLTGDSLLVRVEHFLGERNPAVTAALLCPALLDGVGELLGDAPVLFKEKVN